LDILSLELGNPLKDVGCAIDTIELSNLPVIKIGVVRDGPLDIVEHVPNAQRKLGQTLGKAAELRELVLITALVGDLDEMVQSEGLLCFDIRAERQKAPLVDIRPVKGP
jgi:hypothetical protein